MNDSLSSGQPLYLLYSAMESARARSPPDRPSASRDIATLAMGRVRFHVTGSPPTCRARASARGARGPRPLIVVCSAVTRTTQAATAPSTRPRVGPPKIRHLPEEAVTASQFITFLGPIQRDRTTIRGGAPGG